MSPNAESEDPDGPERILTPDVLPGVFRSQSSSLHELVDEFAEEIETNGEPTATKLDSIRTELIELEAAIEDLGADLCDDADPWEHVGEYSPPRP